MLLSKGNSVQCYEIIIMKQQNITYQSRTDDPLETVSLHIGIKPMRLSSNTYNTQIISYTDDCHLIVNHGQDLLIYNSRKKQVTHKTHSNHLSSYINVAFSNRWRCIFLLDAHQNLSAYAYLNSSPNIVNPTAHNQNDELLLLGNHIDLKSLRHCIDFLYIDQYNAFIVLDADTLKIVYVTIHTNHLRSLFSNAYRFRIEQSRVRVLEDTYFLQFSNEIKRVGQFFVMHNAQDVKIIWHANDQNFNDRLKDDEISTHDLIRSITSLAVGTSPSNNNVKKRVLLIKKICESPEQVSTVLFDPDLCILICGTTQGDLKVFKINMKSLLATVSPSKKFGRQMGQIEIEAKSQLLFKLSLHNYKSILNIQLYSPKVILTIGSDQYMEVISLDQMASIQRFKCDTNLNKIQFINSSLFMAVKTIQFDQYLYAYQVALNYQLLMQHNSQILHYFYVDSLCVLVLSDNSVNALQIDQERLKYNRSVKKLRRQENINQVDEQKGNNLPMLPRQSFVPPRCKSILGMQCYPYRDKDNQQVVEFWILTDQSQIYEYRYQRSSGKNQQSEKQEKSKNKQYEIIGLHEIKCFKDTYSHETKYKVTKIKFIDIVPVHYDSDIKEKHYQPDLSQLFEVKPIIFGTQTGQIIITFTLAINKIISRIRLFGQPVISITTAYFPPQQVYLSKYSHSSVYSLDDEQGGETGQKMVQKNQKENKKIEHHRRLVVFGSYKQIICVIFSNCQIPQTVYKLMLGTLSVIPKYRIKNITKYFISIVTGNTPKVIFPTSLARVNSRSKNQSLYGVKLFSPKIIIHEGPITCLEYCKNLQIISGDELGKIAIWNLHSEILITIVVTEAVSIQLAYFFNHSIIFGHHGKVFFMNHPNLIKNGISIEHDKQIQKQLIKNQNWVIQNTRELSSTTSPAQNRAILQLFKEPALNKLTKNSNQEEQQTKMENLYKNDKKSRVISSKKQLPPQLHSNNHEESEPFDKYVADMKKSFVKLAHQVDGYNPDTEKTKEKIKTKEGQPKKYGNSNRNRNKKIERTETLKVRSTAKFIEISTQQPLKQGMKIQRENFRLKRAKSILNKFKQLQNREDAEEIIKTAREISQAKEIQQKQKQMQENKFDSKIIGINNDPSFSLPQIKNYSSLHKREQLSLTEIEDKQEISGRQKKNRNKKYQFLFHFPKQGLYSQLISKNLLQ